MFSLSDKIAVVTGANKGVGYQVSKRLREAGARVFMLGRNTELPDKAAELGNEYVMADVGDESQVKAAMDAVGKAAGRIDILVNNAAIIIPETDIADIDIALAKKLFDINFFGYMAGIKYALPYMPDGSCIVNMASNAGVQAFPGYSAYNSSKSAIIGLTKTVALELADRGIRVNSICPASIDTPMLYQEGCENELKMGDYCWPLGRFCKAEEVAALVHFLASDDCRYITGEDVQIDGGYTAGIGRRGLRKWLED
ncbi:MAG: SDR family oxidoreductase [Clostridiales Family XIII bacterium]|jgi:3alpha(or 20beta)-hydroxysteroid dehydrogenase|nr:SDR family oxidoreductase [Clostridiales Family XIII bacterium]